MPIELADDYYLVNFKQLISFVANSYAPLLDPEELAFEQQFSSLPDDAQKLYVRLLCRSKSIFRLSKLHYAEIGDLNSAARLLAEAGFVAIDEEFDLSVMLPMFTRAEILQRIDLSLPKSVKRPDIDAAVLAQPDAAKAADELVQNETLIRVRRESQFQLYKLCFFGNLYQDMTDFVLRDIGLTSFEDYPISQDQLVFQTRQQLADHLQYYVCSDQLDVALEEGKEAILSLHSQLPVAPASDPNLKRRVDRLTNTLARQLERIGDLEAALSLYNQTDRPPSRERQARVLAASDKPLEALEICKSLLAQSYNEEEKQFAESFGARLAKSAQLPWQAKPRYRPPTESLVLQQQTDGVEAITREHYAASGCCYYTENALFNGLFGLAFWDIIFAPLSGVFFNPFQHAPADFYEPEFRLSRAELIEQRWNELEESGGLTQIAMTNYAQKYGIQNPMVQWQYLSEELLTIALSRIPLAHWKLIFSRLLNDLRHNRNGFPDLIFFPEQGDYCLIEVKGPGDTLQKNQIRWMAYFAEHDIPHKVAHVSWLQTDEAEP